MRRKYISLREKNSLNENKEELQNSNNILKNANDLEKSDIKAFDEEQQEKLENISIRALIRKIKKNEERLYPKSIDISCPLFKENNFILSPKSLEKCNKVYHYMIYQVPCILEGETGTSKSFTAAMMAKYRQWQIIKDEKEEEERTKIKKKEYTQFKYIKFSLSKETKISDLFGKYSGDSDSLDGIKMTYGPFIEAFSMGNGHCLHLDEINLAPVSVLQCIEEALDTKVLSIEITGLPLKRFEMKPNFCLIATQNRKTKFYKDKRESAGLKFLSKFQIVNFEEFSKEELIEIAKGIRNNICEKENRKKMSDEDLIKLINFHLEWSKAKENDFIFFTLRQIYSCIEAYSKGENIYNVIYNIYGKTHDQQEKFELLIEKYFIKNQIFLDLPPEFPNCFKTQAIHKIFQQINFSFNNGSNVIIIGKKGCGKTQFSLWMAEYYNKKYVNDKYEKLDVDFMICTEETSCSDLIGKQILCKKKESGKSLLEWNDGFLLKGIKEGKCLVFDSINEISSKVTERANNLFDLILNSEKALYFEVPENPNKKEQNIEIKKTFRVIATCDEDKLNKMSPAFINRFKIIYFEDQLTNLDMKNFIKYKIEELSKKSKKQSDNNNAPQDNKPKKRNLRARNRIKEDNNEHKEEINKISKLEMEKNNAQKEKDKEEFIDELYKTILEDNKKIINSISILSFLIEAVHIFKSKFPMIKNNIIIDYIFRLIDPDCKNFDIDNSIYEKIKEILKSKEPTNKNKEENKFFFINSNELCKFLTKAYSAYLIHLHMRFEGPTGIGKTVGACALARMIMGDKKYYIQSFHSGTKPTQCYGGTTIIDNNVHFKDGLLTLAMTEGSIFIADEFNLGSSETMKSLLPSLSHFREYKIYIPGLEKKIQIKENFTFIACQNKIGTLGRNQLPPLIESSLKEFIYPSHIKKTTEEIEIIEKDVQNICIEINNSFYNELEKENKNISDEEAKNIGKFMLKFNQLDKNYIQPLSFRDIKKIFKRIYYQNNKREYFIGFKPYHNVIFYILSKLNKQNIQDIKNDLVELITDIFNLQNKENLNCYFENNLEIINDGGKKFLQKGLCKVNLSLIFINKMQKRILSFIKLLNFLNPLFNAVISSDEESLLFLGKTSCKTFLCETLLQENPEIINLNQETKVEQLLGGPVVLNKKESTFFYFKYLCYICGKANKVNELFEKYNNNNRKLKKEDFIIKKGVKGFNYALNKFKKILFDNKELNKNNKDEDLFSDYIIAFKPGFILEALLKDRPFVLKNISNLYSDVLERFNQFFSEEQKIVLVEDIYDTFTKEENKEISFLNNPKKNRVLATANSGFENKLSEAILSRFTVINVESYENEEEKIIIEMHINQEKEIDHIIILFKKIESLLQITITLSQKIKIIKIISELKNSITTDENIDFVEIILFNLFKGLFEFRTGKSKFQKFKNLFRLKKYLWNYEEDKSTLEKAIINGKAVILSKNTHMYIEKSDANDKRISDDIAYTEQFCENIDIIHTSIKLNIPLILEGEQGQGKKTALKYIFELLNIKNVVNIYLSENTKNDDLLGKITATTENNIIKVDFIETDLLKALINENNEKNAIIFHNINKASPGIFEILENIFDFNKENILLPNGENKKKNIDNPPYLFGIFDSENGKINRNSLPNFLLRSCIYFIVQNPNGEDIHKIITSNFKNKKYKLESNYFEDKFLTAVQIQNNYTSSNDNPLSLNDINKFLSFRDKTYSKLDINIISQFIFVYRHTDNDKIQEIINKLQFKAFNFIPKFSYIKDEIFRIVIEENEINDKKTSDFLELKIKKCKKIEVEDIYRRIETLTNPQKHCLLFLSCSILSNSSIILQGNTNSGKSHLINLFADMLGKQLYVYQMNKDISTTMFFGQSMIRELSRDDNKEISELCKELSSLVLYDKKNFGWNPNNFNELCEKFEKMGKNNSNYYKANQIYKKIKDKISLTKRFEPIFSPFCEALNKGYWILIEQIESAPIEIIEKLIPLCGDNPELKIIKGTKEITYKRNNLIGEENINDQFRIFFTFNPYNNESKINTSLFSKCVVFTLPQVDSTPEYSAKIYYGSFKNVNYPMGLSKEISGRLSNVHNISKNKMKNDNLEESKNFSENQFTGRTIKFIANELTNLNKNQMKFNQNITDKYLSDVIKSTFEHYYFNSFNSSNNLEPFKIFKSSIIDNFCQKPKIKIEMGDDDLYKLYKDIFDEMEKIKLILSKINDFDEEDDEYIFHLSNFWNKCLTIKCKHLNAILMKINKLNAKINNSDKKIIIFGEFYGLIELEIILKTINTIILKDFNPSELKLIISDSILLKKVDINLQTACSKLILYNYLLRDKYIITDSITPDFLPSYIFDFISNKSLEYFEYLIFILYKYRYLFERFYLLFPFKKLIDEEEFNREKNENLQQLKADKNISILWLELFYIYWKNKIHFTIQINKNIYTFKVNDGENNSLIEPYFIFEDSSGFYLAKNSHFYYLEIKGKEKLDKYNIDSVTSLDSYAFYQFLLEFSNYKKYIPTSEQVDEFEEKLKLDGEELSLYNKYKSEKEYSFNIEGIFKQDINKTPSVIRILSLYFNYSIEIFTKIKNEYFTKTEKDIYNLILEDFDKKLIKYDYLIYYELIRTMNNYFKNNIDLFEDETDYENISQKERYLILEKLEKALYNLEEIKKKFAGQNFKDFSIVLENKMQEIEKINNENQNKIMKENMINEINNCLDDNKNDANKFLIESIKKKILNMKDEKDSNNKLKSWNEKISTIIEVKKIEEGNIKWPKIKFSNEENYYNKDFLKHKNFIDCLIKYSEIKQILNKLENSDSNNILGILIQLSKYDEMRNASNYIFNQIDENFIISSHNKMILNSVLNSSILKKLSIYNRQRNIISFRIIQEMFNYFNNLIKREIEKDEIIYIIQNYSFKYKSNFKIIFPNFYAMDFIYLFIDFNNDSEPINGYLIKDLNIDREGLKNINNLNSIEITSKDKIKGFISCLNNICRIIFEKLGYNSYEYNERQKEFVLNLKKNLQKEDNKTHIIKLCDIINNLYDESELKILNQEYEFNLEDISFRDYLENYIFLDKHIIYNKYPSLVYFLTENKMIDQNIFDFFYEDNTKITEKKDSFPFWLLCLRYYSSLECIISKDTNYFSLIIEKNIKNYLSTEIKKRANNRKIGIKWLNLICSNNNPKFFEPLYERIKLFLYRLSKDDYFNEINNKSYINYQTNIILNKIIEDLVNKIFVDNSLLYYYTEKNNDDIISFFKNPNQFLFNKINNDIIDNLSQTIDNKKIDIERLIDNLNKIEDFKENELLKEINNQLKIKNDDYNELIEIYNRENKQKIIKNITDNLYKYNKLFNEIKSIKNISFDLQIKIKEILELKDELIKYNNMLVKHKETIKMIRISYKSEQNNDLIVQNEKNDLTIYKNEDNLGIFYILPSQLKDIDFKNKDNEILNNLDKTEEEISINILQLKEDIGEILIDSNVDNNNNITLLFGNDIPLDKFYDNFTYYKKKLKELKEKLILLLNKQDIITNAMLNNKTNKKDINNFISLCYVKFSDDSKCEVLSNSLMEIKKILDQIHTDYNLVSNSFINDLNRFEIRKKFNKEILKKNYELKEIPENIQINDLVDFSEINEKSPLSIPIINVDSQTNEISCCFSNINSKIGPIFPSLYSGSYKINIITVSKTPLLINLLNNKNIEKKEDYIYDPPEELIIFNKKVDYNKPIEIEIRIPKIKDNTSLKEIHVIQFSLEINSQKNNNKDKSLIFPIKIKFEIMPIIIKFSTKNKKILKKDNSFLISDNIYSYEEIAFTLEPAQKQSNQILNPMIQIEGLNNNNSSEPQIVINNKKRNKEEENDTKEIILIIPNNQQDQSKMDIYLNIYYSYNYKIPLYINSNIMPFNYSLTIYDLISKEFKNEECIIKYDFKNKLEENNIFNLYAKFEFPEVFNDKYFESHISIENKFTQIIEILNEEEILKTNKIKNNYVIRIKININKKNYLINDIVKISFISIINEIQKKFDITFINEDFNDESMKNYSELDENISFDNNETNKIELNEFNYFCVENLGILYFEDYMKLNKDKDINQNKIINLRRDYTDIDFNNFNLNLPKIQRPKGIMSIKEIEDFYTHCIKIIRLLPPFIHSSIKLKDENKLREAEKIFCTIFEYYKLFPFNEKDNSFLHYKINEFKSSFISLIKKLYYANIKVKQSTISDLFHISEYELLNDKIQSDYIFEPNQIILNIPKIKNEKFLKLKKKEIEIDEIKYDFDGENQFDSIDKVSSQYEAGNYLSGKFNKIDLSKNSFNNFDENYFTFDKDEKNDKIEIEEEYQDRNDFFKNYKKKIQSNSLKNINLGNKEYIQKLEEEAKINQEKNIQENLIQNINYGYLIDENVTKTIEMNQDKFEHYEFSDKNAIQWVLKKIEKIDDNNELSILNSKGYLPLNNFFNQKNLDNFPILELSNHLLKLANQIFNEVSKLIGPDSKTDILLNKICVILLIDGSCYINPKKKVFNFHILCSFAIALHLLEIPYGISVVADGRYKIILKQFEDPHSFEIFEKVFECLMIRRFRDNLANSQKFAKETYMFSKEFKLLKEGQKPTFYDEHPKKIIITITDGLDEELKLTSQWNKVIFNDPDISFGFIFYKPDLDNAKDKEKIEKLWNNFINETKKARSRVIVNIIDKEMKNYSKLAEFLRDLIGNRFDNLDMNNNFVDYEPSFLEEKIILNSIESLNNISFKERGNKIKDNQIYIRNYPLKYISDGIIRNDNKKLDKNKLGQICRGNVNQIIEKRFKELIDIFIIKQSDIDKMSLEKIFKKNKASQKVLSTSGSEIDIVSLIISILNKEPRPKIFWEETGEMKRQYSVSIIIDNSISCFGDISRAHSFQVIRELLSPLLYIDIS